MYIALGPHGNTSCTFPSTVVHNGMFQYEGSQVGHWVSLKQPVQLIRGLNELTLLSEIVGLQVFHIFYSFLN
jgi:hypothetical protein